MVKSKSKVIVDIMTALTIVFGMAWAIFVFAPDDIHYEEIGDVVAHNEGEFRVQIGSNLLGIDDEITCAHQIIYIDDKGASGAAYYDEISGWSSDHTMGLCVDDEMQHVYRYKWWTYGPIYFIIAIITFLIMLEYKIRDNELRDR